MEIINVGSAILTVYCFHQAGYYFNEDRRDNHFGFALLMSALALMFFLCAFVDWDNTLK